MTVLKEGAAMAQLGGLMGAMTVVFTAAMTGWIVWTWWPSRRLLLERVARMPLEED
jgi:hypothetical protein